MNNKNNTDLTYFTSYQTNDTAYKSEVEKYGKAIPSRDFIAQFLEYKPQSDLNEIARCFGFNSPWQFSALENRLNAMIREERIFISSRQQFSLVNKAATIKGRLEGRGEGYGYLHPETGGEPVFISPQDMRQYLHGDHVYAQITGLDNKGRRQAKVTELIERKVSEFIGRIHIEGDTYFVRPENRKINQQFLVAKEATLGAKNLQIVRAKMCTPPTAISLPTAKITSILGDKITANIATEQAILEHNLPHSFSLNVTEELTHLADEVLEKDKHGRKDYRDLPLVTIDGITARDFDDAVYCHPMEDQHVKLYVAIADVAHYVHEHTALNEEALERGTSVYFPDRVIPMLPEKLSNGLCSLNPEVDRLCMVCELVITPQGGIKHYEFFEGVMRSHARLTYETVAEIIEGNESLRDAYAHLVPHLDNLYALFHVLRKARDKRGSINFETQETVIEYDELGNIEKIVPSVRTEAHMIIEECMITANIAAATFLEAADLPTLYRVHPRPLEERLKKLRTFLQEFNLGVRGGTTPSPKDYAECLEQAKANNAFEMIQTVMLRSLSQALYQPQNEGHFGLSLTHYAHFTSPIRRYPDLLVHRGIKYLIHQRTNKKSHDFSYDHEAMVKLGEHTSHVERRADEAVRDVTDWLKCQYMEQHIGQIFKGHVSGVTNFGLFVALDALFIEGLIHISNLKGDFYHFDADHHRLVGERTGNQFRLNDPLTIRVADANTETKFIDFEVIALGNKSSVSKQELAKILPSKGKKTACNGRKQLAKKAATKGRKKPQKKT